MRANSTLSPSRAKGYVFAVCVLVLLTVSGCATEAGSLPARQPLSVLTAPSLHTVLLPGSVAEGSHPAGFVRLGSQILFFATDATHGRQLWSTDGTPAGTHRISDVTVARGGKALRGGWASETYDVVVPSHLTLAGKLVFFTAGDALWRSDGTPSGTGALRDLAPQSASAGGFHVSLGTLRGRLLCLVTSGTSHALWASDGTRVGTTMIRRWRGPSMPGAIALAGNRAFFTEYTARTGPALWVTDGTRAGMRLVRDIVPGPPGSNPQDLTAAGSRVFFTVRPHDVAEASAGVRGPVQLWTSDGSARGTKLLLTFAGGRRNFALAPRSLTASGRDLFFFTGDSGGGIALWRSDGTRAGTYRIFTPPSASAPSSSGRRSAARRASRPHRLRLVHLAVLAASGSSGSLLLFESIQGARMELWRTDGTARGTKLVAPLTIRNRAACPRSTQRRCPAPLPRPGGQTGHDAGYGAITSIGSARRPLAIIDLGTPWITDGSAVGTHPLVPTSLGPSVPLNPAEVSPTSYRGRSEAMFSALSGSNGQQPWITDGTAAGTRLLVDIDAGARPAYVSSIAGELLGLGAYVLRTGPRIPYCGYCYLDAGRMASNSSANPELSSANWVNALAERQFYGPYRISYSEPQTPSKTVFTSRGAAEPMDLTTMGRKLLFFVRTSRGVALYGSDRGSKAIPLLSVKLPRSNIRWDQGPIDCRFEGCGYGTGATAAIVSTGKRAFVLVNGTLYVSDGTLGGTHRVKAVTHVESFTNHSLITDGGYLYFVTSWATYPGEGLGGTLWRSDGTTRGTVELRSFPHGWSPPGTLKATHQGVYFTTWQTGGGPWLWMVGPNGATTLVSELPRTAGGPQYMTIAGDRLFFVTSGPSKATNQSRARPRFPTAAGTLWVSDGTAAGTRALRTFHFRYPICPFCYSGVDWSGRQLPPGPASLVPVGNRVIFLGWNGSSSYNLWVSDGTAAGTRMVSPTSAPLEIPDATRPVPLAGRAYFAGYSPGHGVELWQSNGTAAGTRIAQDLYPGPVGSDPTDLAAVHGHLFFSTTPYGVAVSAGKVASVWVLTPARHTLPRD